MPSSYTQTLLPTAMGNRAKSYEHKVAQRRKEIDGLYAEAKDQYLKEHQDPSSKGRSYQVICDEVGQAHYTATGHRIRLSTSTLQRHVRGGRTKSKFNVAKGWLTNDESELIVSYVIDLAQRGFPLKMKELQRQAENVLRARLGNSFPSTGLGKHWAHRFVCKHADQLQKYVSRGLDKRRAGNVNPTTHEAWFALLGKTIETYGIEDDCIYGSDEVGFLLGALGRYNVLGPVQQKIQYECAAEN